jgi:hypothetical protein
MAKNLKKYQTPGSVVLSPPKRTRTVVVSPDGEYRTTSKTKNTANSYSESSKTRRTAKGFLKGAEKVNMMQPPISSPEPSSPRPITAMDQVDRIEKAKLGKIKK